MMVFLFFPENGLLYFMHIVSIGDCLHEMPEPVFWEKYGEYFNMNSAENFTQNAKC